MPQNWAIRLAIVDDLRFLSHHDTMRLVERLASRARLPLKYSQGYNPRPDLSLLQARPVGVAALAELMTVGLDEPMTGSELLHRLNDGAPDGLAFRAADALPGKAKPRVVAAEYVVALDESTREPVRRRLDELRAQDAWPVRRFLPPRRGKRRRASHRQIDLRPLVERMNVDDSGLELRLVPLGDLWARPGEVLSLLGMDERVDLARVTRTDLICRPDPSANET